jgi:hypothetical protein
VGMWEVARGLWCGMLRLLLLTRGFMAARSLEFRLTQQEETWCTALLGCG